MRKKFVTIFPICENVHLTKDLGQIPYFLHKKYGYDSFVACYNNSPSYDYIETEVKGLKIEFLENKGAVSFLEKGVLKYIYKNAKKIDVLNLFHFSKQSFAYGLLYKLLNPKGCLFLKIDGYNETFAEGAKLIHSQKKIKAIVLKKIEKMCLKRTDLLTIENTEGERLVKLMYPKYASKVVYFPVGVNDMFLEELFKNKTRNFEQKENIILTTGRIGLDIKNHEMILKALTAIDLKDWKMVFVGAVNPVFQKFYDELVDAFPLLRSKVIFTGHIANRNELYEWYNRSKLFCMTSWKESFSLSIAEAFYFGNYIIGAEGVMSMNDITDNGKYGTILKADDHAGLAEVLQKFINDQDQLKELYPEILQRSHNNFTWSKIIGKIEERISQKIK